MEREIETGRFRAKTDNGKEYIIVEYQELIFSAASRDDPHAKIAGSKRLLTTSGLAVGYVDSKTYKIVQTGETIRKV